MAKFSEPKPKQKSGESDDDFKKRMEGWKTRYHAHLLKSQAAARMPRVVQAVLSVGGLAVHNPNSKQVEAIIKPLEAALAATRERLLGKAEAKAAFVLPD